MQPYNTLAHWDHQSSVPQSLITPSRASCAVDYTGNLPIEIFTEIIKIVIQDSHTTAMTISHVSKQWRDVMHNIALFWDVLVLTNNRPKEKARFWIERSKGRLRELSIRSSAVGPRNTKSWSDVLRELAWGHLKVLRVEKWQIAKFLHEIGEFESLRNLETLEIDAANPLESFSPSIHNSTQSKLRNLFILSSTSIRFQNAPFQVHGLTCLSLSNVKRPLECLFALLKLNPLLEYLSLSHVSYGSLTSEKVTMDRLKTLRVECFFPLPVFAINMPNLETILIEDQNRESRFDGALHRYSLDAIRTPLGHTRLSKIILRGCDAIGTTIPLSPHGLILLLKLSPNLQYLGICDTTCEMNFVLELLASTYSLRRSSNSTSNQVPVCPNLTHIDFSGCRTLETGPLLRMVKSRLAPRNYISQSIPDQDGDLSQPNFPWKEISSLILDDCPHLDPGWVGWLIKHVPYVSWKT